MDAVDREIVRALQQQPEISIVDLAEKVGLSHTPCWRRIKRLEDDGIILGKALLLNPQAFGLTVNVFANVRLKQHDEETLEALERAVHDLPEIVDCFSMSGDSDYLLRVIVKSIDEYELFLKKTLLHMPGVASVNSRFVLKRVKTTAKLPI
jgi:Lrp/AsnC family transcriptional regulator